MMATKFDELTKRPSVPAVKAMHVRQEGPLCMKILLMIYILCTERDPTAFLFRRRQGALNFHLSFRVVI